MVLSKCPRCDLNYITEQEKYCKVCLREMKGDIPKEEVEICNVCNQAPALPGKEVCFLCLKELEEEREENGGKDVDDRSAASDIEPEADLDEIMISREDENIPKEIKDEFASIESMREDEDQDSDEEEEEI
ncbi:MAG: hypothetical protein Q4C54_09270 [Clostridia bacterium]|nr:hypothetical protein [Clostridia bacterium]